MLVVLNTDEPVVVEEYHVVRLPCRQTADKARMSNVMGAGFVKTIQMIALTFY